MLGSNYEKMALISPAAAKDWPQTQLCDDLKVSMSNNMDNNSSRNSAMVAMNQKLAQQDPQQLQQQQQQQALKCPRCDSSNTKFCYYNNYSLTQPRHFCKACKRYWTRGGTLRNVPVGGGCRKNKRVKRPNINSSSNNNSSSSASLDAPPSSTTPASSTIHHPLLVHHNLNPSSESYLNNNHHLFYGHNNPDSEVNLLYQSRFGAAGNNPSSRVVFSGLENTASGYDLIPGLGLGFSPGNNIIDVNANPSKDMEMHGIVNPSSNSFLSSCYSSLIGPGGGMFSPPSSNCTTATTMSSLISSYGLQKFNSNGSIATDKSQQGGARVGGSGGGSNQFQTFFPFEEMQMSSSSHGFGSNEQNKDVKVEEDGQNRLGGGWKNEVAVPCQNHHMEQSDPTSYWNNNNNAAAAHAGSSWPDLANIGSSVTSLI